MRKITYLFALLFIASTVFIGCGSDDPLDDPANPNTPTTPTTDPGVHINGVVWATRNVDTPGTFATRPESAGMLYRWNRRIGWSATDPIVDSNGNTTWEQFSCNAFKIIL